MKPIHVVLVDDHDIVRLGLMTLLKGQPDIDVVGEARSAAEGLRLVEIHQPEIVLMDIRMPGEGAIEAVQQIRDRYPGTAVVVLTSFTDDGLLIRAIRAGASGYVLKSVGNAELLRAIHAAVQKQAVMDPRTTAQLFERVRQSERKADENAFRDLSEREMQVLDLLAQGKSNADIARTMSLSENTVRNYIVSVMRKLHASNRIELATYAVEHHLADHLHLAKP